MPENESTLHKRYRLLREDTIRFNHEFWARQNSEFSQQKEAFMTRVLEERYPDEPGKRTLSSDEMSEFYKQHLDGKWRAHLDYNIEWQKRNFRILGLSVLVALENVFRR